MKKKGFTLIEVIGAVVILGIISMIAFVVYSRSLAKFKADYYVTTNRTIKKAGEEFFGDNTKYRPEGILEAKTVNLSTLEEMAYLKDVKDYKGKKCDSKSHVIIIRKGPSDYIYNTCLMCPGDNYDNTDNKYCDISWSDPTTIDRGLGTLDDIYIYLGTDREELRELLTVTVSAIKKNYNGEILEEGELIGKNDQVLPENMDIVDLNKIGTYTLKYKYKDYDRNRRVIVYKNDKPNMVLTGVNTYATSLNNATQTKRENFVDGSWNQSLEIRFSPGAGKYTETKTEAAKYQIYSKGEWTDICEISGNRDCVHTIVREMNEKVKFRILDSEGRISEETPLYDIRIDNTKPECSLILEGTIKDNNWYITPVKISFTVNRDVERTSAEAVSGIKISNINSNLFSRTVSKLEHIHNPDIANIEYQGYTEDQAGNYTICRASFKKDGTNPTCPAYGGESTTWNNTSRTITFGCNDNLSGCVAGFSGGSKTFGTPNVTNKVETISAYEIKDAAGNQITCTEGKANVYVDRIAPTCTNSGDSTTYIAGTRRINFGCSDDANGSGCNSSYSGGYKDFTTTTVRSVIPGYQIRDIATNTVNCPARTADVYVDTTKPSCSLSVTSGTMGDNGWYNSPTVEITATYNDGNSGIGERGITTAATATYNGQSKHVISADTNTVRVYCYVKDAVGNINSNSITVKKDSTKPTCSNRGDSTTWVGTSRTIFFGCGDNLSGCITSEDSKIFGPDNVSHKTAVMASYPIKDAAGNTHTCPARTADVYVDKTSPTCSISVSSGTMGDNGWYRSPNVIVTATPGDTHSGVGSKGVSTSSTASYNNLVEHTVSTDTSGTIIYCHVRDGVGNTFRSSVSLKKDSTKPTCPAYTGTSTSWSNGTRTIGYGCNDAMSGCAAGFGGGSTTVGIEGQTHKSISIPAYNIKDNAGNTKTCDAGTADTYIDRIKPICDSSGDSTVWTNSPRAINSKCKDADSGCVAETYATRTFSTTTKTAEIAAYTIYDKANNQTNCTARTANVFVDTTNPSCSINVSSGTMGNNNWYTSAVGFSSSFNDAHSGVSERGTATGAENYNGNTTYSISSNTSGTTVRCYVKDVAGNKGSNSVTVKKDDGSNASGCSVSFNPTGWTNGMKVKSTSFTTPPISGCDSVSMTGYTLGPNCSTSHQYVIADNTFESTKALGSFNLTTSSGVAITCNQGTGTVNIDRTKPTISCSKGGASTSGVTVTCNCGDTGSGVNTCAGVTGTSRTINGVTSSTTYYAIDKAGNSNSTTVTVNSRTINTTCNTCARCSSASCASYSSSYSGYSAGQSSCSEGQCNFIGTYNKCQKVTIPASPAYSGSHTCRKGTDTKKVSCTGSTYDGCNQECGRLCADAGYSYSTGDCQANAGTVKYNVTSYSCTCSLRSRDCAKCGCAVYNTDIEYY